MVAHLRGALPAERIKFLRRRSSAVGDSVAVKSAARAAIVMPAVFAFADKVIGQPQTSLFAAFGSFALLVLVEFTGPPRTRLVAYLALACVGVAFITLGTLCSRHAWLAAGAMAVVGFATLFAGVINGYFAAAATGALLTFVLPVTLPAPNSAIPERLEGWGLAAGAGISALMLLWPPRQRADLQREAAGALRAVADHLDADRESWAERARVARASVDALGRRLLGTQHRPTGPTGPMAALASLPDELDWLLSFLAPAPEVQLELACAEDAEALAAAAQVLRASAERLQGLNGQPDFQRLEAARDAVARALMRRLPELPVDTPAGQVPRALDAPFRIRALTYAARQAAAYGLLASGAGVPELDHLDVAQPPAALEATERLTIEHASVRSVWFRNSLRGAVGLAVAVYIAQRAGLQHGFWVVLGTLSVLRSNALGTGWSIVSALAGTAVGIVLGALLVIGIGTHEAVLWGVLPVAVFLAAYAPRAISFAAGQAGFTVVLFVLFNIIQPVGWSVGLVRVEDVAIGFAISLLVGLLFWPRGAAALLLDELATAYARGAAYVVATARRLSEGESEDSDRSGRAANAALHRLDDAFRQYLAERSATAYNVEDVAALVGGAARVRRAAQSLAALGQMTDSKTHVERCARNLDGELQALQAWYIAFGSALIKRRQVPPPHIRDTEGRRRLLTCVRDAARGRDKATVDAALVLLWSSQHLDNLWLLGHTSRSAPTPHGQLRPQQNRLDTRAAREPRAHGRAIARRPREVREMAAASATIGFVGLGHMGGNMAARILAAGYPVYGEERSREHAQHLIDEGLQWCDTPREVAEAADVVFTSVPDDGVLEDIASGPDGVLAGLAAGKTWVDVSTVSPQASRELAARVRTQGAFMLDAPVSGSVPQVQSGTLTIMVGGDEDAYRRVEPILRELGTPTHIGENGQGLALKLAINISLAVQMLAFAEGLLLAERSGVDRQRALDVMEASPIGSPMLRARASIILDPPEEAWFDLGFMHKDIELALEAARRLEIPLPTAERADEVLERAQALGYERRDLAALFQALEQMANGDRARR